METKSEWTNYSEESLAKTSVLEELLFTMTITLYTFTLRETHYSRLYADGNGSRRLVTVILALIIILEWKGNKNKSCLENHKKSQLSNNCKRPEQSIVEPY